MTIVDHRICPDCKKPLPQDQPVCPSCGSSAPTRIIVESCGDEASKETLAREKASQPHENPAVSKDMMIGRTILGQFMITRRIGEGGMGVVYEAEQIGLGRKVAVKFLTGAAAHTSISARFEREAKALCAIKNPNIVTLHNFGALEDGTLFLAMEFVEGETLEGVMKKRGALSPESLVRIARQIGSALVAAHHYGIIHRDLKPANIIITQIVGEPPDVVKILDFGIARMFSDADSSLTATGSVLGTPEFMSPEQAKGEKVTEKSDLYSLGLILYKAATGQRAINAKSALDYLIAHNTMTPIPIQELDESAAISREFGDLIMSLLEKDPEKRPESVQAFLDALMQVPEARPSVPVSGVKPDSSGKERTGISRKWIFILSLFLIITAGLIIWIAAGKIRENSSEKNFADVSSAKSIEYDTSVSSDIKIAAENQQEKSPQIINPEPEIPKGMVIVRDHGESFAIDIHEVSFADYNRCVSANACKPSYLQNNRKFSEEKKPVVGITQNMAHDYCSFAGKRLPSEKEWNLAAFSDDGRYYPCGKELVKDCCQINKKEGTSETGVHNLDRSASGIFDMTGNVSEWVDNGKNEPVALGWNFKDDEEALKYRPRLVFKDSDWFAFVGFRCVKYLPYQRSE
jgi:serine/threonine-protein kinase